MGNITGTAGPLGYLIVVILIVLTAIVVYGIGKTVWKHQKDKKIPEVSVKATVSRKMEYPDYHMQDVISHNAHRVIFQTKTGDRLDFMVPAKDFENLKEGKSGRLTYKADRFISFH